MAADVTTADVPAPSPREGAHVTAPATPSRPHRRRFALVYGGLGAIVALAIAGAVIFAGRSIRPAPAWSAWKPHGGGLGAAQQIADHVAKEYRLPNGEQVATVITKAPSVTDQNTTEPIHYVAIKGRGGVNDQIYPISSTNGVMYTLCGLGPSCSIASGTPSAERARLVRREILELSLYTFKYIGGMQSVIAFIPPKAPAFGHAPTVFAVYLHRNDLLDVLKQPLTKTLGSHVPLPTTIPASEVRLIDQQTDQHVYTFGGVSQVPTGDLVFVLSPLPQG